MSTLPAPPLPRLASIDRSQLLLHTVDVERLIDEDHSARSIWHLVGRLSLSLYYAKIAALEGHAGRDHSLQRRAGVVDVRCRPARRVAKAAV